MMDLLLNFVCSLRNAKISAENIVVFVGQEELIPLVNKMGIKAMSSSYFGPIPSQAAGNYGDLVFARMMWLKAAAVFVATYAGFDVLFQVC